MSRDGDFTTRVTLLMRLGSADAKPRELAWNEFFERYAPIIAGFARKLGCPAGDIDDVVQDVLTGFYAASPRFVYDPARGRFRGYLKTCVVHSLQRRASKKLAVEGIPVDELDPADQRVEQIWQTEWEKEILNRAIDQVRTQYQNNNTFQAWEQIVIHQKDTATVCSELKMSADSVYQSKKRVTDAIRRVMSQLDAEAG